MPIIFRQLPKNSRLIATSKTCPNGFKTEWVCLNRPVSKHMMPSWLWPVTVGFNWDSFGDSLKMQNSVCSLIQKLTVSNTAVGEQTTSENAVSSSQF